MRASKFHYNLTRDKREYSGSIILIFSNGCHNLSVNKNKHVTPTNFETVANLTLFHYTFIILQFLLFVIYK